MSITFKDFTDRTVRMFEESDDGFYDEYEKGLGTIESKIRGTLLDLDFEPYKDGTVHIICTYFSEYTQSTEEYEFVYDIERYSDLTLEDVGEDIDKWISIRETWEESE